MITVCKFELPARRHSSLAVLAAALTVVAFVTSACGSNGGASSTTTAATAAAVPADTRAQATVEAAVEASKEGTTEAAPAVARIESEVIGDRRFEINVPAGYNGSKPVPLVVVLHGYTGSGAGAKPYFQLEAEATKRGFLTVYPDGTKDQEGNRFWNATDACCQLTATKADDSAYLMALIDRVKQKFALDPKRVFFVGHSNGGFMSYRMACEHADRIAAIVSVAGATFADVSACKPSQPVSVLQVHGTSDTVISFTGGSILGHPYPGAQTSVTTWAAYNGCSAPAPDVGGEPLDFDELVAGKDARVTTFAGCALGGSAELWTIDGGSHEPKLTAEFASSIMDFLLTHPKP